MRHLTLLLAALLALSACQKDAGSGTPDEAAEETAEETADDSEPTTDEGYSVGSLKVIAAVNVYKNDEATKPEKLQEMLVDALEETESYDPGAPPLTGSLTYDARTSESMEGGTARDVVLFGSLRKQGSSDPTAKYTAEVLVRSDQAEGDTSFAGLAEKAVQLFAERIDAQVRIEGADAETLVKILKSEEESEKSKLTAIQQIRERELTGTEEVLREILASGDDDSLRVASAAALAKLGDEESRDDILELAQTYSREKNPNFLAMIYVLGDMGGDEVVTYLRTVSEAHSVPAVRQVAKEAYSEAVEKTAVRGQR